MPPRQRSDLYYAVCTMAAAVLVIGEYEAWYWNWASDIAWPIDVPALRIPALVVAMVAMLAFLYSQFYERMPGQMWVLADALLGSLALGIAMSFSASVLLPVLPALPRQASYISLFAVVVSMSAWLARNFARTNRALETQLAEARRLSERAVATTKGLFQAMAAVDDLPGTLGRMTRKLEDMNLGRHGMALMLVKVRAGELAVSSAGISPLYHDCRATGQVEEILVAGLPLGYASDATYGLARIGLSPGDAVLMTSDGLPERRNPTGEPFGYDRTHALFKEVIVRRDPSRDARRLLRQARGLGDVTCHRDRRRGSPGSGLARGH